MPGVPSSISVIIPTHERPETCAVAVQSALAQSRPPLEVIVCCDGCAPETVRTLCELDGPVRVLDLPKSPGYGYGNRNRALKEARGEIVAWLADDDLYLPDHLERIGEVHDAGDVEIVQSTCCHVRTDGFVEAMGDDWNVPFIRERLLRGERVGSPMSGISHRLETARLAGGWDSEMEIGGDIDFWRRMVRVAPSATIATPTVLHLRGTGRPQSRGERAEQNRALLARMSDTKELARLRAEMGHAVYRRLADHQQEAHHLRLEVDALRAKLTNLEPLAAEAQRLQETLDRTYSGGWWRLRARLLPLLRVRSAVARRLGRARG
jgi:glycosyltransferase involved in cell wall biosynthesis